MCYYLNVHLQGQRVSTAQFVYLFVSFVFLKTLNSRSYTAQSERGLLMKDELERVWKGRVGMRFCGIFSKLSGINYENLAEIHPG